MAHHITYHIDDGGFFSRKEREHVVAIFRGLSVKETAKKLFVSENTVSTHRKSIREKTGQHCNPGVMSFCLAAELVKPITAKDYGNCGTLHVDVLFALTATSSSVGGHYYGLY